MGPTLLIKRVRTFEEFRLSRATHEAGHSHTGILQLVSQCGGERINPLPPLCQN